MKNAFSAAWRGIRVAWLEERHLKLHSLAAASVINLGIVLKINYIEWSLLALCMGLVVALEYMNSAIERLADRVSTDRHPLLRDAKDFAAGGVLVASVAAACVGLLVLGPKLWTLIFAL